MLNRCWSKLVLVFALVVLLVPLVQAQEPDPLVGTWELNLAKSKWACGTALPKSDTRTFEAVPNGLKWTNKGVDVNGKPYQYEYTAYYDGKDYPLTGTGTSNTSTISMKRIDRFTSETISKEAGKVVAHNKRVVSPDGKVWTLTSQGADAQGKPCTDVSVFDRR